MRPGRVVLWCKHNVWAVGGPRWQRHVGATLCSALLSWPFVGAPQRALLKLVPPAYLHPALPHSTRPAQDDRQPAQHRDRPEPAALDALPARAASQEVTSDTPAHQLSLTRQ